MARIWRSSSAKTCGWTIWFNRSSASRSEKTISPSFLRSMILSEVRISDPKASHHLWVCGALWRNDRVGDLVGVESVSPRLGEFLQNVTLTTGDPTRESDLEHWTESYHRSWSELDPALRDGKAGVAG